jgi:hypothetical protein
MSIEAMAWVLKHAQAEDSLEKLVLIGLANHVAHDGTGSWAGQGTLARYAVCSIRTVQRKLGSLEARGIIRRGDQHLVDHIPEHHRPVVWDLVMDTPAGTPRQPDAGSDPPTESRLPPATESHHPPDTVSPPPRHSVTTLATLVSHKPSDETSVEPSEEKPSLDLVEVKAAAEVFDVFWAAYPRKQEKAEARKRFRILTTGKDAVDPQAIIDGARRYASDPNRDPDYTKLPPTWLNRGCWEDEPMPPRHGPAVRDRQGEILANERRRAQAADAAEASRHQGLFMIEGGQR